MVVHHLSEPWLAHMTASVLAKRPLVRKQAGNHSARASQATSSGPQTALDAVGHAHSPPRSRTWLNLKASTSKCHSIQKSNSKQNPQRQLLLPSNGFGPGRPLGDHRHGSAHLRRPVHPRVAVDHHIAALQRKEALHDQLLQPKRASLCCLEKNNFNAFCFKACPIPAV